MEQIDPVLCLSSPRILVVGDPHFKLGNQVQTDALSAFVRTHLLDNDYGAVVVLGDVLDRHETIHMAPLTRAIEFLSSIVDSKDDMVLFVLIGNHDRANNVDFCSPHHPFTALKQWKRTIVVDRPICVDVVASGDIRRVVTLCPYVAPGRFIEALAMVPRWRESHMIFAHQEFRNAKMGMFVSATGDEWPLDYPFVVSGHVHQFDRLQANILYTGTPLQLGFADSDSKRLVSVDLSVENVEDNVQTIDTSGLPGKRQLTMTVDEFFANAERRLEDLLSTGQQVRIVIQGTKAQIATARTSKLFVDLSDKAQLVTKTTAADPLAVLDESAVESAGALTSGAAAAIPKKKSFHDRLRLSLESRPELWALWRTLQSST